MKSIISIVLIALIISSQIKSQSIFNPPKEIGIYEHLDSVLPNDIQLVKQDSTVVNLKSLINKPTVISFVYYECPGLCSPLLNGLADVIDKSDMTLGKEYQVITISFNYQDTPTLGKKKKKNYVASIKKKIDESQWIWLTGDSANIQKVTDALGFKYRREGKEFLHPASIMVVSPKGKITRYLYGTEYLRFDLKMAVIEASEEKAMPTVSNLLKYCFNYDAKSKKYLFNITSVSGSLIILMVLVFLFTVLLKKKPIKINKV